MSCPADMKPYIDSYNIGVMERDKEAWRNNQYVFSATLASTDMVLNGRKSKAKYAKHPILSEFDEDEDSGSSSREECAAFEMRQRIKFLKKQGLASSPK